MSFRSDSITGSLFGTSSWAVTASYHRKVFDVYPYTGSASLTGSSVATGDFIINNDYVVPMQFLLARPTNTYILSQSVANATQICGWGNYSVVSGSNVAGTSALSFDGVYFNLKGGKMYELEARLSTPLFNPFTFNSGVIHATSSIGNINPSQYLLLDSAYINSAYGEVKRLRCLMQPAVDSTGYIRFYPQYSGANQITVLGHSSYLMIKRIY